MSKPSILVVEDDGTVRNMIAAALETQSYSYRLAETGSKAISEAMAQKPDIMLLDLGLPDMDGVNVIAKVREWSNMPIIVISARNDDPDKVHALDAGADDYLTKPFSVDELLARLRSTQRRLQYMKNTNTMYVSEKCLYEYIQRENKGRLTRRKQNKYRSNLTIKKELDALYKTVPGINEKINVIYQQLYISYLNSIIDDRPRKEILHAIKESLYEFIPEFSIIRNFGLERRILSFIIKTKI